jgi:hypothetical protein
MDNPVFFKWLKINVLFFVGSFLVTSLAVVVPSDTILRFGRMWGGYTLARAPTISDPANLCRIAPAHNQSSPES